MSFLARFYREHLWFKQLVDQTLHFVGAMLLLFPAIWGQFWASALLIGLLREVEQMRAKRKLEDPYDKMSCGLRRRECVAPGLHAPLEPWSWHWRRTLDVAFWFAGGMALSLLVWLR